jgi:hypothetical protein
MHRSIRQVISKCLLLVVTAAALLFNSRIQAAERPFTAAVSGSVVEDEFGFESLQWSGTATHLGLCHGRFEMLSGAFLIAADGAGLLAHIRFHDEAFDAQTLTLPATVTVEDGTGRFAGATGTIDVLIVFRDATLLEFDCLMIGTLDY